MGIKIQSINYVGKKGTVLAVLELTYEIEDGRVL
jgi:hypothetical protein